MARLLKALQLRPRRTIRVVLFTNEENGLRGAPSTTAIATRATLGQHVLMIESDAGVFAPVGFGFSGNDIARAQVTAIASLLGSTGATRIAASGGGADIGPSVVAGRVPAMSLEVDGLEVLSDPPHRSGYGGQDRSAPTSRDASPRWRGWPTSWPTCRSDLGEAPGTQ